jgi:hypothetical protein
MIPDAIRNEFSAVPVIGYSVAVRIPKTPEMDDKMEVDSPGFEPDGETVLLASLRGLRLA